MDPPRNCTNLDGTDGIVALWILHSLWVDDQDLADYLKATYDLPVIFAQFNIKQDVHNGVGTQVWSWNEPGKPASQVTYYVSDTTSSTGPVSTERMYWFNATNLSYANLRIVPLLDQVPLAITPGTMQPPMLYTYNGMTTYLGTGQKFDSMELSANLKRYGDFECAQPLSP
ncbi:MAG: hypothetical protein LC623_02580 [Halobacteriales archaeon]|nr:hypothetical protein [Halobacteriales archaeon]